MSVTRVYAETRTLQHRIRMRFIAPTELGERARITNNVMRRCNKDLFSGNGGWLYV
jgi:hypothetical protein